MFPHELSTGLCSLNPQVDRLVQSCLMEVNAKGDVVRYELHDGVIYSDQRMTYTAVDAILTQKDADTRKQYAQLVPLFELMGELFEVLNARRRRRGSIDFDLPENELVLDEAGRVSAVLASERNVAHRLIEEFMLLANETVAQHLSDHGTPALFRIHEAPDVVKVEEFEEFISSLGTRWRAVAQRAAEAPRSWSRRSKVRRRSADRDAHAAHDAEARYDVSNLGIRPRREEPLPLHVADPPLSGPGVHRSLRAQRQGSYRGARAEWEEELPEAARQHVDRERLADEAEREIVQWKKVRFHGRQGRRGVRGLRDRRRAVRSPAARRASSRRPGAHLEHGGRLLLLHRPPARAVSARTREEPSAGRQGGRPGHAGGHGAPAGGAGARRHPGCRAPVREEPRTRRSTAVSKVEARKRGPAGTPEPGAGNGRPPKRRAWRRPFLLPLRTAAHRLLKPNALADAASELRQPVGAEDQDDDGEDDEDFGKPSGNHVRSFYGDS
jgi:hypothetical protein